MIPSAMAKRPKQIVPFTDVSRATAAALREHVLQNSTEIMIQTQLTTICKDRLLASIKPFPKRLLQNKSQVDPF